MERNNNSQRTEWKSKIMDLAWALTIVFLIVVCAIWVFLRFLPPPSPDGPQPPPLPISFCQLQLTGLGVAITNYAEEDEHERLPTANKWCDLLIQGDFTDVKNFICNKSDAIIGESSYAINENIAGKRISEISDDVVLLFETNSGVNPLGRQGRMSERQFPKWVSYKPKARVYRLRWNQFGGADILTTENHGGKGCNIVFKDGLVWFIAADELGKLKWKADPNNIFRWLYGNR